jgi:amidase
MKPTHGLVPYTGILSLDPTIDHAGPITRTVADNALLLQAIAGPDGFDPRQAGVRTDDYLDGLERGADGLRIGVLREGFGRHNAEPDVDEAVRAAAARFARLGAKVEEVSVPLHPLAAALTFPVFQSGALLLFHADGCALGHEDLCVPSLVDRLHAWRERPHALPDTVKYLLLATELLRKRHGFRYWAKAMNFVRRARAAYDDVLGGVDLFLLPTTPMKATPLPLPGGPREAAIEASFAPTANTQIFDHTHHPALSVPCGESQGLPIGMMLVGRRFEEATLYRAAHAFEQTPASKAAQRPRSEAKPSGERAPASKAAQRRGEAKAGEVKEARSAPRRSPSRPGRGKPRRRPSRSRGSRR